MAYYVFYDTETTGTRTSFDQPTLLPADQVPDGTINLELDIDELERPAWLIRENGPFRERVGEALIARTPDRPLSQHFEPQIFDGFLSWTDERIMPGGHDTGVKYSGYR